MNLSYRQQPIWPCFEQEHNTVHETAAWDTFPCKAVHLSVPIQFENNTDEGSSRCLPSPQSQYSHKHSKSWHVIYVGNEPCYDFFNLRPSVE